MIKGIDKVLSFVCWVLKARKEYKVIANRLFRRINFKDNFGHPVPY